MRGTASRRPVEAVSLLRFSRSGVGFGGSSVTAILDDLAAPVALPVPVDEDQIRKNVASRAPFSYGLAVGHGLIGNQQRNWMVVLLSARFRTGSV